jgi:hypothetical protein
VIGNIGAFPAVKFVFAGTSVEEVVPAIASQLIISVPAFDVVISVAAIKLVVT